MGKDPVAKGGGRHPRRGGKKTRLTRGSGGLASSLLRAIGASEEQRKASADAEAVDKIEGDFYEYEEEVPEEERGKNRRFDDVDRLEYELPSDFEDEEIDEDAAFGEDEVEANIQRVTKKRSKEVDLNSDEDNDDEEQDGDISSDGSDENGVEEESEEEEEEDDDDDDDEGKHRRMIEAVTGKSASVVADRKGRRGKEKVLLEAYPESEFNLNPSSGSVNGNSGITVMDLMTPLHSTAGFGTIRKRMEQLQKRGAPLEAPLPKIIQDRLNRQAGYMTTCEDVTKWQPMVKMNREAPFLAFNKKEPAPPLSTASLAASFIPTTDFEKEIHALLRESKLEDEREVEAAETLELNKLTVEEVRERQERLAKMRSLLFRHEAKSKRLKKIKSKTFHRLQQKDQKSKTDVDAAIAEADPEAAKAASIKREFHRAQERMTLKHKNSTRWAKRILRRGLKASENDGTRDAIADQLRTHAALTRKIHSATISDSEDDSSNSEEEEEDVVSGLVLEGNSRSKVLAKAKVKTLKALEDGDEGDLPNGGLFSLPFMARAIEKKKKAAENDAMAMLEQLEQLEQAEQEGNILDLDEDYARRQNGHGDVATTSGRVSFGDAKNSNVMARRRDAAGDSDSGGSGDDFEKDFSHKSSKTQAISNRPSPKGTQNLVRTDRGEDDKGTNAQNGLQTEVGCRDETFQKGRTSSLGVETVPAKNIEVSIAGGHRKLPVGITSVEKALSKPLRASNGTMANAEVSTLDGNAVTPGTFSDDDSDDADVEGVDLLDASGSQQDLIKQAFAGDDVEAEFEKMKSQVLDEEVPQGEGPVSLPGWGQWTRIQQIKGQPAWLLKEQELAKRKKETALSRRKDANLKHVIISEKLDKKASKFTVASVPFPFKSREVFERSIRLPIGREFNTDKTYRDMIRPAVIKSAGIIIDPIQFDKSSTKKLDTRTSAHAVKRKAIAHVVNKKASSANGAKKKRHQ